MPDEVDKLEKEKDKTFHAQFKESQKLMGLLGKVNGLANTVLRDQLHSLILEEIKSTRNFIDKLIGDRDDEVTD